MTQQKTKDIVITRTFDAPRPLVWKVWTDPKHIVHWWGPRDFTSPEAKSDFRVGGRFLYCMRTPDGQDLWSGGLYEEIVEPQRIVATDYFADADGNEVPASYYGMPDFPGVMRVHVTLEDQQDKTRLTLRHEGHPADIAADAEAGWNESLDKLAAYLASGVN